MASDHAVQNNTQTVKEPLRLTSSQQQQDEQELGRKLWVTVLDEFRSDKASKNATDHTKESGARGSPFFKLPGEIRNMIYHHYLESEKDVRQSRVSNRPIPRCWIQAGKVHSAWCPCRSKTRPPWPSPSYRVLGQSSLKYHFIKYGTRSFARPITMM